MQSRLTKLIVLFGLVCVGAASCDEKSPTNPTPTCSITVAPGNQTFNESGGTGSIAITTAAGCAWSAAANAAWITLTGPTNGTGSGTVTYTIAPNPASAARNGTLTVGGQSHSVTQQGRTATACSYELSPESAQFGKDAGTGTFAVSAPDGCTWTTSSNASWLTVTSGNEGSGSGSISFSVARNQGVTERWGGISVAGQTFSVRQSGDSGACEYSVAPVSAAPCMPGGSLTATITTQPSCPWTANPDASWLSVPSGTSGTGSAVITISFPDNYNAPRQGRVAVRWPTPTAGQNIHVSQAGCLYAVSRSTIDVVSAGGPGTFNVIQQSDPIACGGATQDRCVWSAQADVPWITITTSMPQAGDNPVNFTVAPNGATAARVGRITVRDKVVVITQTGL
jgi:hypothetical protein